MKLVVLYILAVPLAVLGFAAIAWCCRPAPDVAAQPRRPRPDRDALRLRLGRQQQRLGVRRPHRQHRLVQRSRSGSRMLIGRFFLIIPALAIAGSLVRKQQVPGHRRARSRPTRRCSSACSSASILIVVGLTFFPVLALGPDRRAARACRSDPIDRRPPTMTPTDDAPAPPNASGQRRSGRRCSTRRSSRRRHRRRLAQARPPRHGPQPGHVRRRGRQRPHDRPVRRATWAPAPARQNVFAGLVAVWLWFTVLFANFAEAMAEGRGKAQADTLRKTRAETVARRPAARRHASRSGPRTQLRPRRPVRRRGRRAHPRRRRRRRGHRHASTSRPSPASRPRSSASPAATARPSPAAPGCCPTRSWCASPPGPARRFLDRMIALVEGAEPPEDPERDRPQHPAGRAHHHLPAGRRHAAALRHLLRRPSSRSSCSSRCWSASSPPPSAALLSAIGIAGMDRLVQRNVLAMSRPGGRGGRRRVARCCSTRPAPSPSATARRPSSSRSHGVDRARAGRGGPARRAWPTRPRRAARSSRWPRSAFGLDRAGRCAGAELVPFTAQTRMSGVDCADGPLDPQGRRRLGAARGSREQGGDGPARARRRSWTASPPAAARRSSWPTGRPAGPRRDPPQGHREAGHARALRRAAGAWASAR